MWQTFKFEDRSGLGEITSVFVDYPEDWNRVLKHSGGIHLCFASLLVKDPLVDLDPKQTGLSFGFFPKLSCYSSVMLLEQISKNFYLLISLANTHGWHDRHVVVEFPLPQLLNARMRDGERVVTLRITFIDKEVILFSLICQLSLCDGSTPGINVLLEVKKSPWLDRVHL